MIINMSGGGSPGKIVTVHVTYGNAIGSGANVVCTNGKKTFAGTTDAAGDAVFKLTKGTWTITADKNGSSSSTNVSVSEDCTVNMSLFAATINVTYPAGSTCTATNGSTTLTAPNTSGTWACVVPNTGTWTISLGNGFKETVNVNANGANYTVNRWYLYNRGDQRTYITNGWEGVFYNTNIYKSDVQFYSSYIDCNTPNGYSIGIRTKNTINTSGFKTLKFLFTLHSDNGNTSNYSVFGFGTDYNHTDPKYTRKPSMNVTTETTASIDCSSLSSAKQVIASHLYNGTLRIYQVWLEA